MPGKVIDRDSMRGWKESGSLDTFTRAKTRVREILASYRRPEMNPDHEAVLRSYVLNLAHQAGLENLPILEDLQPV
jgi:trimethylamine:corrinoid methyltransferase-like protein